MKFAKKSIEYRGEIILDDSDNCYIASTTKSLDFPMVNAAQNSNAGLQDAVLFSLNSNLSSLLWSTYYGGSQNDAAYSIQLNSNNQIYATGGTMNAVEELCKKAGYEVIDKLCLIDLLYLHDNIKCKSLVQYE